MIHDLRIGEATRAAGHADAGRAPRSTPWSVGGRAAGVPVRDLLVHLWRRKLLVALAAVLGISLGLGLASVREPRYAAEGLLVIDTAHISIPELSALASGRTVEPWGGRSEARILTARDTVAAAVDRARS